MCRQDRSMLRMFRAKSNPTKSGRRREELRRALAPPGLDVWAIVKRPELMYAVLIAAAFALVASLLVIWSRDQIKVTDGQVMTETRLKRLDFSVEDAEATQARRDEARQSAPRVYSLNELYLDRLRVALSGLPKAVADTTDLEEISTELRDQFRLTSTGLAQLQNYVRDGEVVADWKRAVDRLIDVQLRQRPLVTSQEYGLYSTTASLKLRMPSGELINLSSNAVPLATDTNLPKVFAQLVSAAGFPSAVAPFVTARLEFDQAANPTPTIVYDDESTKAQADLAAAGVEPVQIEHKTGEVIYRRGQELSTQQYETLQRETALYAASELPAQRTQRIVEKIGTVGLVVLMASLVAGYVSVFYPRIVRNPLRVVAVAALQVGALAITCLVVPTAPKLLFLAAVGPTLLVSIIVLLSYDQRIALFLSMVQCVLVTLALQQGVGMYLLLFAGCGIMVAQLRDVRHRGTLIRASIIAAVVLILGAVMLGALDTPMVPGARRQILANTGWAAVASIGVGFLVLGILPSIEKLFDITTGMTLAELRDPKQPLLRQLALRAPGTYNHCLQVANIAEAAAEAIRADGLLVYVGALYHDVGKMNKPEYFVENQAGGYNKHEKLSPAMSLLVLVGHVKDGIELAREYGLPRTLQHFIESHHGTTLVEYFYHAAREQAEADDRGEVREVEEIEFRYPGPKPQTKEAAILMLADAVEGATRAMAEPNPSRIEAVVRTLSHKRLIDGQFDQCDLTFRELATIEDSIIKSMNAIYHGRISYPTTSAEESEPAPSPRTTSAMV
jgi:putative nucleotidyltransferase with HDIG domain